MNLALLCRQKNPMSESFPVFAPMAETIANALNAAEVPAPAGADENPWQVLTLPFPAEELGEVMTLL
jgi:hypothetical protein